MKDLNKQLKELEKKKVPRPNKEEILERVLIAGIHHYYYGDAYALKLTESRYVMYATAPCNDDEKFFIISEFLFYALKQEYGLDIW